MKKNYYMYSLKELRNEPNYKYHNYFVTNRGDYRVYSRDGKRFYIDTSSNSKLVLLPNTPFKNATLAKKHLVMRLKSKSIFPKIK